MDRQSEIRDFLMSRRARISPEEAGLPAYGGVRRVPGLRREEVAQAAAISVDYYNRLERGKVTGASAEVLSAIASTLALDDTERDYLFTLFHVTSSPPVRKPSRPGKVKIRSSLQRVLDDLAMPAVLENARLEVLSVNPAGRALYDWLGTDFTLPFSIPRFMFLDPRALDFYPDWELMAHNVVAMLRAETAQDPHSAELHNLIGQLATGSEPFRQLWAAHDVQRYRQAPKRFRHPAVGELEFISESLDIARDEGLTLLTYTIEPGSRTAEAMAWLASWTGDADDAHLPGHATVTDEPTTSGQRERERP